jgi:hypothetical protein
MGAWLASWVDCSQSQSRSPVRASFRGGQTSILCASAFTEEDTLRRVTPRALLRPDDFHAGSSCLGSEFGRAPALRAR